MEKEKNIVSETELNQSVCPTIESEVSDSSDSSKIDWKVDYPFLISGSELQALDIKVEWVVDKILPKQSITLLHGKGGIGKTWLCLHLADCVSRGQPFMGLDTQKLNVVYVDFENSMPVLVDRARILEIENVMFWHASDEIKPPPMLDKPKWSEYIDLPENSLLIFDTLRASQNKDENSSQDMTLIMSRLKKLRDSGFTILMLHHTPKSNAQTYKGSTAIQDLADHVVSLHKKGFDNNGEEGLEAHGHYRLGTKDKTRYEPFEISMDFDPQRGFVGRSNPIEEYMLSIKEILEKNENANQSQLFEQVKKDIGIARKATFHKLLGLGEGRYWNAYKVKNSICYRTIETVQESASHSGTDGQIQRDGPEIPSASETLGLPVEEGFKAAESECCNGEAEPSNANKKGDK